MDGWRGREVGMKNVVWRSEVGNVRVWLVRGVGMISGKEIVVWVEIKDC